MIPRRRHHLSPASLLPALALAVAVAWCARSARAQAVVWEWTPYRVQILLALDQVPELTDRLAGELEQGVIDRIDALVGAAWQAAAVRPEAPLRRAMLRDLEAVSIDSLPPDSLQCDKVFLLVVRRQPAGYQVVARELDVRTRTLGTPVRLRAGQPAVLRDALFDAMRRAFSPLAMVEEAEGQRATLRLRAAGFRLRDENAARVAPGTIFRPIVRYNQRDGTPKRITPLPWTYLVVEKVAGSQLDCRLYSGLRSALTGRRRGRVERLALAVTPPQRATQLVLKSRTTEHRLLEDYEVYTQVPGQTTTQLLGRTDRFGSLAIPPARQGLRILFVKSGSQLLARLPIVAGLEPRLEATIVDDHQRLAAEGFIIGAQERLVDVVTRRAVLMARIRGQLKAGRPQQADKLVVELYALQTRAQMTRYLDVEHKKRYSDDPLIQRRIDALFENTRKLAVQYLDPAPVDQVAQEVRQALSTAAQ